MFSDAFEELCSVKITNVELFDSLNKMILSNLAKAVSEHLVSKNYGTNPYGKSIKVSYITSSGETCIAKFGTINYGRLKSYIELYNEDNKKVFRMFISSMLEGGVATPKLLAGFYRNYVRKANSNEFSPSTLMVNEFVTSLKSVNNTNFSAQVASFLIDENHEYFSDPNSAPIGFN